MVIKRLDGSVVEQHTSNVQVVGSNPTRGSNDLTHWSSMEYNVLQERQECRDSPYGN